MPNWNDLRLFLAVVRHGSLTGASKSMGINQSTAGRRLDCLEEQLGVRLFEKVGRSLRLTPVGVRLYQRCTQLFALAHDIEREMRTTGTEVAGRVALGTDCVTFEPSWLVQAVQRPEAALFGASNDGGYWAACVEGTGGPSPTEQLFADIPWSRPDTLDATLRAAAAAGIEVGPLPPCFDVDDAADLRRLLADPRCPAAVRALGRELSARPGSAG